MTFLHCLESKKKTNNQLNASSNTFLFSICRIWIVCCIIHFRSYMRVIWLLCAKLSVVIVKDDIINKILCEYQKMWLNCSWLFFSCIPFCPSICSLRCTMHPNCLLRCGHKQWMIEFKIFSANLCENDARKTAVFVYAKHISLAFPFSIRSSHYCNRYQCFISSLK